MQMRQTRSGQTSNKLDWVCSICPAPVAAFLQQPVREAATICPAPCKLTFDLLTLKVVSELRVTWAVLILVF